MYLGLDIGTSSVKGVLIDDKQKIVASATVPLKVSRLHEGWSLGHSALTPPTGSVSPGKRQLRAR